MFVFRVHLKMNRHSEQQELYAHKKLSYYKMLRRVM